MRIGKVLNAVVDIINLDSVANAIMYKQETNKIHPFTNLVLAHQLLEKPMRTIYCLGSKNTINKPLQNAKRITTLKELASNYKNIPIAFLEPNYMQVYCEHDNYKGLDPNGFVIQPHFNIERFLQYVDCNNGIPIKLANGNRYTVPITDTVKLLKDYNEIQ